MASTYENKTVRFYFRVESADGVTPVATSVIVNGQTTAVNLDHTNNWIGDQEAQDKDTLRTIDITVSAPTWTKPISESDFNQETDGTVTTSVSIIPSGGDVLLMGLSENYTFELSANPSYDPSLPESPSNSQYVSTNTGANFCEINCDTGTLIASQPLIDGVADTTRYDFSSTVAGGDVNGSGNGCLAIYDGETGQFDLQYNCYTPAS